MSQNDNDHDVRDESMRKTTRRGLLAGVGLAGLGLFGSGGASANLSGGPEADAMAEHRVPKYRVPESELDSPGVVGREVTITSGGATYETGDQLVDLGDRWELVSPNFGSVSADELAIGDRDVMVPADKDAEDIDSYINQFSDSDWSRVRLVSGATYEIQDGTFDNSAIHITTKKTVFDLNGATIYLPDEITEPDKGKQIIDVGEPDFDKSGDSLVVDDVIIKNGTVDGNQQNQNPDNIADLYDGHNIEVQGSRFQLENVRSINATGDGVELSADSDPSQTENAVISDCHFIDCFEHPVQFHGCRHVEVSGCIIDGDVNSPCVATWTKYANNEDIVLDGCTIRNGESKGVEITAAESQTTDGTQSKTVGFTLSNCTVTDCGGRALEVQGRFSEDVLIEGCRFVDCGELQDETGVEFIGANDVTFRDNVVKRNWKRGISVATSQGVEDLVIEGNVVKDNNQKDGFASAIGFTIDSVGDWTNIHIEDNKIVSRGEDGQPTHRNAFQVIENSVQTYSDIYFRDNHVVGSTGGGIYNIDNYGVFAGAGGNQPALATDVRQFKGEEGNRGFHDGTNSNTRGPAVYVAGGTSAWVSDLDGTTIS